MSNDQIIRSSKPHEVTIPEGSNSARSIRNKVGQREVEQEREEKISVDKQYTDKVVQAETEALASARVTTGATDSLQDASMAGGAGAVQDANRIQVPGSGEDASSRVKIPSSQQDDHRVQVESNDDRASSRAAVASSARDEQRVTIPEGGRASDNIATLPQDTGSENRVQLPSDTSTDHRATLATDSTTSNRAQLPTDTASSNRATLSQDTSSSQRATHDDESIQDTFATVPASGASAPHAVSIPSDSIQDSFAQVPDMTHTDTPPVKVDGHGITDPSRVVVEDAPVHRADVPVAPAAAPTPAVEAPAPTETVQPAPTAAVTVPAVASVRHEPAQVSAPVADKKAEEFRGRVVKLRDEVDQLNRRLDEIKK